MRWTNKSSYDVTYCRRRIEDFIRNYESADTVSMVSQGRCEGKPHIKMKLIINSDEDVIEEYRRLEFLGYLR